MNDFRLIGIKGKLTEELFAQLRSIQRGSSLHPQHVLWSGPKDRCLLGRRGGRYCDSSCKEESLSHRPIDLVSGAHFHRSSPKFTASTRVGRCSIMLPVFDDFPCFDGFLFCVPRPNKRFGSSFLTDINPFSNYPQSFRGILIM